MTARPGLRRKFVAAVVGAVGLFVAAGALAATGFTGLAAGDMTPAGAVLWTRTVDAASGYPLAAPVTAQLAAEPEFHNILFAFKGATDPARAATLKIEATGLQSHTRYYYRFVATDGAVSPTGTFTTAPREYDKAAIRFAEGRIPRGRSGCGRPTTASRFLLGGHVQLRHTRHQPRRQGTRDQHLGHRFLSGGPLP